MSEPIAKEIKQQILERIQDEGIPAAQAAREHGVNAKTVYGWLAKLSCQNVSIAKFNQLKCENERLYNIIGKLTTELNRLKRGR